MYSGVNLVLTKGKAITKIPQQITVLGQGALFNVPIPFIFTIVVLILVVFIIKKTKIGRYVYAIGNSVDAAKILGVKTDNVRITMYSMLGGLSALAGLLMMARLGASQPSIGTNWPMNSIAASVIGGLALTANKFKGIRAAVCHDIFSTQRSILSNNGNVLCMGERVIGAELAKTLVSEWISLEFKDGPSTAKVQDIINIETENMK